MNHSLKFPTSCFLHNSRLCSVLAMGIDGHQTPSPLPTSSTDPLRAVLPSQLTSFGQTLATLRSATSLLLPCARTAPRSPSRSLSPSRSPHHPHHHYSIGLRAALGQPCRALRRAAAPTELNKETHDLPPGRVDRRDGCQLRTPSLNPAPRGTARHGSSGALREPAPLPPPSTPSTTRPPRRSPPNRRSPLAPRGRRCPGKVPARPRLPGLPGPPRSQGHGDTGRGGGQPADGGLRGCSLFCYGSCTLSNCLCFVVFFF